MKHAVAPAVLPAAVEVTIEHDHYGTAGVAVSVAAMSRTYPVHWTRDPAHGGAGGQRGVALLTALLVVSLATVAAVAMATRQHVDVRRTGNLLHGEQAYAYALAAESWARVIMDRDAEDSSIDTLEEDWAFALPPISVEGGFVDGRITDLQGRFNINNLVGVKGAPSEADRDYFNRLLVVLDLDPALTNALLDWLDADIDARYPDGAEDDTYLLNNPPYRAANRPLSSVSELGLVKGFSCRGDGRAGAACDGVAGAYRYQRQHGVSGNPARTERGPDRGGCGIPDRGSR